MRFPSFRRPQPISLLRFSIIISVLNLLFYNIPFFGFVQEHFDGEGFSLFFFMGCLVIVMVALNFMVIYLLLFLTRWFGRIIQAILLLLNGVAVYFVVNYHVLMEESMMGNVFNTRYSEASGFFSWGMLSFVLLLGLLPSIYVLVRPIKYGKWKTLGWVCGGSLVLSLVFVLINLNQTLWIGKYDRQLGGLVMPWSYIVNTGRLLKSKSEKEAKEIRLPDAVIRDDQKTAVVLVIGESARKANFQLYGYNRETNPLLAKQSRLKVFQAQSCATYTTGGVKAILEYDDTSKLYEILPNYASRAGVDVAWRTSNWGEPPVHIDDYQKAKQMMPSSQGIDAKYDELLFDGLRQRIEGSAMSKVLVILHTSTSHGPNYISKYPAEFTRFKPVFENVDEAHKDHDKLVNAYDNSIVYTDYLLNNLIDTLNDMKDWRTAMIFVSDHGESLGENGLYMHGLPMKLAPAEQYEIPFFVWLSSDFRQLKPVVNAKEAKKGALPTPVDQHYVFHSVLNLLSVDSPIYSEESDLFVRE